MVYFQRVLKKLGLFLTNTYIDNQIIRREWLMLNNIYPKGSEWRKWDLHVHTPASFHWNGGKLLINMNRAEIEKDFQKLFDIIYHSDVAVFCFMDYWTFEGYFQFRQYLSEKGIDIGKTILPGMELRVEAPVDYRLNIHVILSDLLSNQQLRDFQSKLKIGSIDRPISNESIIQFATTLDESKARIHGFSHPNGLTKDKLLLLGAMTVEVTKESLKEAMNSLPSGSGYILLPYDTTDGLKNLDWKTHPHADNYFMQTASLFESRDEETMQLFLGIKTNKNEDYIDNFQKTLGDTPKPVICGSDAHRYCDYGNFPSGKITWIKADPNFEGFKQILYEPKDRVYISETFPEEKTPYLVIDKVRFLDKTARKRLQEDWIELNPNLNVIIGGKSSGKSLLLYHIAKAVCPKQVEDKIKAIAGNEYNFGDLTYFDFEVLWKDNHLNSLGESINSKNRKVTYIPQMYINFLAEKEGKKNLFMLINSILEQNEAYKSFVDKINQSIEEFSLLIRKDISDIISLRDDYWRLKQEIQEVGDKKAIEQEIKRLEGLIEKLTNESGFTDTEKVTYERLNAQLSFYQKKYERYLSLDESLDVLLHLNIIIRGNIAKELEEKKSLFSGFNARITSRLLNITLSNISYAFEQTEEKCNSYKIKVKQKKDKYESRIALINSQLKPYKLKIKNQELLQILVKNLEEQQNKIKKITHKEVEIREIKERGKKSKEQLFENYKDLFEAYKQIEKELGKIEYSTIAENIELEICLNYDTDRFSDNFISLFDGRSNLRTVFGTPFNENNEFQFSYNKHLEHIALIYGKLSQPLTTGKQSVKYKKEVSELHALENLFGNYFKIEYNIKHKSDDILNMSPGKRGLVLLQLILHISNATHPILIDQPEDNLDNRTIYTELKEFIKEKKCKRQIILVTHNANLVVSTDAENIIVANQSGQQVGNDNKEFIFEYISGALENTYINKQEKGILYQYGIREHVCYILEGGKKAFQKREQKYGL